MISCPEKESFCWHGDANKSTLFQDTTVVVHIGKVAKSSLLLQKNHFFIQTYNMHLFTLF